VKPPREHIYVFVTYRIKRTGDKYYVAKCTIPGQGPTSPCATPHARLRASNETLALLAALGVFGTGWPDLIVAAIMAMLALQGAWIVVRQARQELQLPKGCSWQVKCRQ
jgi:hypothetical protein